MTMPWSLVPTGQSVLGRVRLSSEIRRLVRFRDQKDDTSVSLLKKILLVSVYKSGLERIF